MSGISAGCFTESQRLSDMPTCHTGLEKNASHIKDASIPVKSFIWLEYLKVDPNPLFCEQDFENHYMATQHGAACRVLSDAISSLLPSQHFVQLSGQPLQNSFSHIKAMVRCSWKKVLGNMNPQNWPCDRLVRTAVFFHIWETSLWICCVFLY